MADKNKKEKRGALSVFRLIVLLVVICCAAYVIWWLYTGYSVKKYDKEVAEKYVKPAAETVHTDELQQRDAEIPEEDENGAETIEKVRSSVTIDFEALKEEGEDVVAWIKIPGLEVIDYPVAQHDDFYFLNRDWTGQPSGRGAIFLEEVNRPDFLDLHTILYGHHMQDGTMFGSLVKYDSEEFYKENGGTILIYTPDATYTYEIFSVEHCANSDEKVYTVGFIKDEVYAEFVRGMKERSRYDTGVEVSEDDRVLTLSTCIYEFAGSRLAIHAKLVATES